MNTEKTLGNVFRSAWKATLDNFAALFLSSLIYIGVLSVLYGAYYAGSMASTASLYSGYTQSYNMTGALASIWLVPLLLVAILFLTPLYSGFVTAVLRGYHVTGCKTPMGAAWKAACSNYTKYLLTTLTQLLFAVLLVFVVGIVMVAVVFASGWSVFSAAMSYTPDTAQVMAMVFSALTPAIIVCVVIGWFYQFGQIFVTFVPGMEGKQAFAAFFSSFRYAYKGRFWRNLGHILLITVIQGAIMAAVVLPFVLPLITLTMQAVIYETYDVLEHALNTYMMTMPLYLVLEGIVSVVLNTVVMPFYFEAYLNAKTACDWKQMQGVSVPYPGYGQPPQG